MASKYPLSDHKTLNNDFRHYLSNEFSSLITKLRVETFFSHSSQNITLILFAIFLLFFLKFNRKLVILN